MSHKIKSVAAGPDYTLIVQFSGGTAKRYDARPLLDQIPAFRRFLTDPEEFSCVQVDAGGYGIIWNDDLDLSCDELWEHGAAISTSSGMEDLKDLRKRGETVKTLEEYTSMPERIIITEDQAEGGFVAFSPDLPGCITCGETVETAVSNALDAKKAWLDAAIANKAEINEPDAAYATEEQK